MARLLHLLPGLLVAVIVTVITSLYLDSRNENETLKALNNELKNKLNTNTKQLEEKADALKNAERAALIKSQEERQLPVFTTQAEIQTQSPTPNISVPQQNSVNAKVNSIGKFVPLSEDQKERLQRKFLAELDPSLHDTETLEEIIGEENANFYRDQRKKSFERVLKESIEKEILFIARKLSLDLQQEDALRNAYLEVEEKIRSQRESSPITGNHQSTLERLVLEEKERSRLLEEKLQNILTPQQFNEYTEYESGSQDMQLWHEK